MKQKVEIKVRLRGRIVQQTINFELDDGGKIGTCFDGVAAAQEGQQNNNLLPLHYFAINPY